MTQYINDNKKSKRKYRKAMVIKKKFCKKIQKLDVKVKIQINLNNLIQNLALKARVGRE
jgi:hypothetical protein